MYTQTNYKTKKQLREDVLAGKQVRIFSPGPFPAPTDGKTTLEGPHYPAPHKWWAEAVLKDGIVVSVK